MVMVVDGSYGFSTNHGLWEPGATIFSNDKVSLYCDDDLHFYLFEGCGGEEKNTRSAEKNMDYLIYLILEFDRLETPAGNRNKKIL